MPMHVICDGLGVRTGSDGRLRSGDWDVSAKSAAKMVGHVLHLHRNKKSSSTAAHVIVDVERSVAHPSRTVFVLGEARGTRPAPPNWARRDYKFLPEDPWEEHVAQVRQQSKR